MALVVKDRVKETTTTTGTGTITLAGAAAGFQSFSVVGNGNTTYYTITDQTSGDWEVGIGTYTATGTTLSRDTILDSSNSGLAVNFGAGSKDVFVTYPAEKSVYKDASEDVTLPDTLTAATLAIDAPTTDATISNNTSITGWVYSGNSFSVTSQETAPTGLFFKSNGTAFYIAGDTGNDITQFTLGTAWDVTTASSPVTFSVSAQDSAPNDVFFAPDGLTMFLMGGATDTVYQYTLGTAWDVTTATYASKSFSVTSQEATPTGLWFKSDGTTMYVCGTTNDTVYQYTLSTAWDVSTASYASISFSVGSQETAPAQVNLSADGTKMWVVGSTGDDINEYNLGTAWNIGTATFANNVYIGFQEGTPTGLFIDSTASNRVYIVGSLSDSVFQYNTVSNTLGATTDRFYVSGEGYVDGNFVVGSNANIDLNINAATATFGTTTVSGTLNATSIITLSGTTTSTTSLGTAATTGTTLIGGTAQTGAITVGQSTGAQTLNLGTGATTNGTTKTINIGTAGVSGSTTTINIGSAVSGATGNINIGNGGTQFLVVPTSSAVNYVQVSGAATGSGPLLYFTGSDANVVGVYNTKGAGAHGFYTNSALQFYITNTSSAVNYLRATGAAAGSAPVMSVAGSDTNIDLNLTSKGAGTVNLNTGNGLQVKVLDISGVNRPLEFRGGVSGSAGARVGVTNESLDYYTTGGYSHWFATQGARTAIQFAVAHTASAVNYVQVTGNVTTSRPTISAQGSDSTVGLNFDVKGTGNTFFRSAAGATTQLQINGTSGAVNYFQISGGAASSGPVLSSVGSDTNIDLALTPKGAGLVRFGTHTAIGSTTYSIDGYIEIKDSAGNTRKLAVLA